MKQTSPNSHRERDDKKLLFDRDGRKIRGYAIISKGDVPEKLQAGMYRIPSQSGNGFYIVNSHYVRGIGRSTFECSCPDWRRHQQDCKHVYALNFWLSFKERIKRGDERLPEQNTQGTETCAYCASAQIVKFGYIEETGKQRYRCRNCKRTFVADGSFRRFKGDAKLVTAVIDLYFKGVSLRKIEDHVRQFYSIEITHVTVYNWIRRFTKLMNEYVATLNPHVSGMWHTDEQMVKIKQKEKWLYCWNVIDAETRFLIANNITEGRDIGEAREIFQKAKEIKTDPDIVVTDGLQSYRKAIKKEFNRNTEHIGRAGLAKKENNNKIERFHNTFRERDKVMRGFQNSATAQNWADAFRLYYNFIRPHSRFNGLTPGQVAGLNLNLPVNRWEGLLRRSLAERFD